MDIDAVADSIGTMQLTESQTKSFKEHWRYVEATVNFNIENAQQLLSTPEHKKDRSHYFFEITQVRLLKEKLRDLEKHEKNNVYGDYTKTKQFQDLKRSAGYWSEKLLKESIVLKEKLGIPGQVPFHSQVLRRRARSKLQYKQGSPTYLMYLKELYKR